MRRSWLHSTIDANDSLNVRYVNPVTFTESFGIARVLVKRDKTEWCVRLGPGFRQYLDRNVRDTLGNFQNSITNDGGVLLVSEFFTPLAKERITLNSRLNLFQALFYSESAALADLPEENYWKSPDADWENVFTVGITDLLMVNLTVQLLYERQVDSGIRLKEVLALGLTYKFI